MTTNNNVSLIHVNTSVFVWRINETAQLILPAANNSMDNENLHQLSCFYVSRCESIDSLVANVHIDGRMEKIDSFCGSTVPKPLMSNGPRLMLEFRGIYSSRYSRGFKATYSFTESECIMVWRKSSYCDLYYEIALYNGLQVMDTGTLIGSRMWQILNLLYKYAEY